MLLRRHVLCRTLWRSCGRRWYHEAPIGIPNISIVDTTVPFELDVDMLQRLGISAKALPTTCTISKLKNGVTIVSVDEGRPEANLSLVVTPAGVRYEAMTGLAHLYKNFLFKASERRTAFRLVRELENRGVFMTADLAREALLVNLQGLRSSLSEAMEFVVDALTHPKLAYYELDAVKESVRLECRMAEACGWSYTLDQLHRVAYRSGLGYSLFASLPSLETLTLEHVGSMADHVVTPIDSMMLIGTNLGHDVLMKIAERDLGHLKKTTAMTINTKSKYYGGDVHRDHHMQESHWMVAFEGVGRGDKHYLTMAVVYFLLGSGGPPRVAYGAGYSFLSELFQQESMIHQHSASVNGLHVCYSDSSLIGVHVEMKDAKYIHPVVEKVLHMLRHLPITDERVQRAKHQLKYSLAELQTRRSSYVSDIALQILSMDKVIPLQEIFVQIDKISTSEVAHMAQRLFASKPSSSFYGPTRYAPFLDQF
jgi:ubiquinol-cytochrome c reductase core subunit 2